MDRGYVDYKRLYKIHTGAAFYITRANNNMSYRRLYSHQKDIANGGWPPIVSCSVFKLNVFSANLVNLNPMPDL